MAYARKIRAIICSFPCVTLILIIVFYLTPEQSTESESENASRETASSFISTEIIDKVDDSQLEYMNQEDPSLWKYIRTHHLLPPSKKPYKLVEPGKDHGLPSSGSPSGGQYVIVKKILKNMPNGFFVEAGAYDGEHFSNTLTLERELNWSGILIEGDPLIYPYLKKKHRKAWISNACLSPSARPQLVDFNHAVNYDVASKIGNPTKILSTWTKFEVQCFPIYAILAAVNVSVVDYFSLDVEGIEMQVLESIPFDRVLIKVFSLEFQLMPESPQILKSFMESKGYRLVAQLFIDFIFAHNSVLTRDFPEIAINHTRVRKIS